MLRLLRPLARPAALASSSVRRQHLCSRPSLRPTAPVRPPTRGAGAFAQTAGRYASSGGGGGGGGGVPLVNFSDTEMAYSSKSVGAILRALAIYRLCSVDVFVRNSEWLYSLATRVLGPRLVDLVVRPTFFGHFCAGEDEQSIRPTVELLQRHGVGGILDYAAEADVVEEGQQPQQQRKQQAAGNSNAEAQAAQAAARAARDRKGVVQARVYKYSAEVACDANAKIIRQAITSVHNVLPEGFAAVKLTALGNPLLLERVTTACSNIQTLFRSLDTDGDGLVKWAEFRDGMPSHFGPQSEDRLRRVFEELAAEGGGGRSSSCSSSSSSSSSSTTTTTTTAAANNNNNHNNSGGGGGNSGGSEAVASSPGSSAEPAINYCAWSSSLITEKMLSVHTLVTRHHDPRGESNNIHSKSAPASTAGQSAGGPTTSIAANLFLEATLSKEEQELFHKMFERIEGLVEYASSLGVRLMIDAEHSYFQAAIDAVCLDMMRRYNRELPIVFNTYQCYLKETPAKLDEHIRMSEAEGWHFAAKLVRGAYMVLERDRAAKMGYECPVHDTIQDTHDCYDACVQRAITRARVQQGTESANVLIASHNQASIERVLALMQRQGLDSQTSNVYFGQLLGMSDHLTFCLGQGGYKAYKYVPYGPVHEVMPYLIRRVQENSSMVSDTKSQRQMLTRELRRRVCQAVGF